MASEITKLKKLVSKLERRYETASSVGKKRVLKKATAVQKRLDLLQERE